MPPNTTPPTPNGAWSAPPAVCSANAATTIDTADERSAIVDVDRALRRIDERYLPSEEEIAAVAGVTTADVRRILGTSRCGSLGTLAVAENADE